MSYNLAASLAVAAVFFTGLPLLIWLDPKRIREQLRSGRKPQL
jgi:hypothetical protein